MRCRASMYGLMRQVGIYWIHQNSSQETDEPSLIQCELEAYLAGLEPLEKRIAEIGANSFLETADSDRIRQFERMLGIPVKEQVDLDIRRRMAMERMALGPNDYTKEGLSRALKSSGLNALVQEEVGEEWFSIITKEITGVPLDLEEARKAVKEFLPAHLEVDFQTGGINWRDLDALDMTFNQFQAADKTWNELELMNREDW